MEDEGGPRLAGELICAITPENASLHYDFAYTVDNVKYSVWLANVQNIDSATLGVPVAQSEFLITPQKSDQTFHFFLEVSYFDFTMITA